MLTCGSYSDYCSGCPHSRSRHNLQRELPIRSFSVIGFADLRIAIVSPFIDRQHGTERAVAELCERLAQTYRCEIHIFSQRVENLGVKPFDSGLATKNSAIYWHKVPRITGPHLVQFVGWFFLNRISRWSLSLFGRLSFDLVLSPGINCSDADAIVVHALFTRLREVSSEAGSIAAGQPGFFRRLHRRAYYALLARMERHIYSDSNVALAAVSRRTAALLAHYFRREDARVIPNGVDVLQFSPAGRISRRAEARLRRNFAENDFVMLLVGNDWGTKGLGTILEAMATHPEKRIRLLVAGNDAPASFQEM